MRTILTPIAVIILALTVTACSAVPPVGDMPESIAGATTKQDHLRIADYFAKKAASYEAESKLHGKMPQAYMGRPKYDSATMGAHCRALQNQLSAAAQEAKALERAHRELAAAAETP